MKIEIDVKYLTEHLVSCEEFCILQLLYFKQETLFNDYIQKVENTYITEVVDDLMDKGYIITKPDLIDLNRIETLILDRSKCAKLFGESDEDTAFYTFFSTYPQKVQSRGGYRPLRPAGVDAKATLVLKKKYFAKVGKKVKEQERVQAILEAELEARKKNNSLTYMPAMEAYLNGYQWEKSEYLLTEKKKIDATKPRRGEQLI
jgi:hypothetical protein